MMLAILVGLFAASLAYGDQLLLVVDHPGNLLKARSPLPRPPFRFIREDGRGTSPKVLVRDVRGALWEVKFGKEVKTEVFATRFASALGYYSDVTHYVARGRILRAHRLKRAAKHIDERGWFRSARFEYRDPSVRFLKDGAWTWRNNPFIGTRQFNGMKVLVMLLSNWDNKDASDRSSNVGIVERRRGQQTERIYYVMDWGGSMGKWGRKFFHNKWDCENFAGQSDHFIEKIDDDGDVKFGFSTGYHGSDFKDDIRIDDVRWLAQRLRRITDSQLRTALRKSGATPHEAHHFTRALRDRLKQIELVAAGKLKFLSE
jgi:hypothetical protein